MGSLIRFFFPGNGEALSEESVSYSAPLVRRASAQPGVTMYRFSAVLSGCWDFRASSVKKRKETLDSSAGMQTQINDPLENKTALNHKLPHLSSFSFRGIEVF